MDWLTEEEIHRGTQRAMLVSAFGGVILGYGAGTGMFWPGAILCAVFQVASLWLHPGSETIAIQYAEHKRISQGRTDE